MSNPTERLGETRMCKMILQFLIVLNCATLHELCYSRNLYSIVLLIFFHKLFPTSAIFTRRTETSKCQEAQFSDSSPNSADRGVEI